MSVLEPRPTPVSLADHSNSDVDPCGTLAAFVTVCPDLSAAEASIYALLDIGLDPARGSLVWRAGSFDIDAPGPDHMAERTMFWQTCRHLWSGLADLPAFGLMTTIPGIGVILVGGYLATVLITAAEFADAEVIDTGGLGALGVALVGMGLPRGDLPLCLEVLRSGERLSVGQGFSDDVEHAVGLLRPSAWQQDLVPSRDESLVSDSA